MGLQWELFFFAAWIQLVHLRCPSLSRFFSAVCFAPQALICLLCVISAMSSTENSKPQNAVRNKKPTRSTSDCLHLAIIEGIGEDAGKLNCLLCATWLPTKTVVPLIYEKKAATAKG